MNIGVVLSGGMAKGAFQIGALRAIDKFIPEGEIKYMSCASIGVLNGYAYVTKKLDIAESIWRDLCDDDNRFYVNQILKSSFLQHDIKLLIGEEDKIDIPFYATLFDSKRLRIVYKNLAKVKKLHVPDYLKASVAMPFYNKPVQIGRTPYYDGAMLDNIPVFPLQEHELDYVICMYFDDTRHKFENITFDNKVIKITFPCANFVKQAFLFSKEQIDDMIEEGYTRTYTILSSILYDGYDNLPSIYKALASLSANDIVSYRITGDVVTSNINRIAQKFAKRKIK